MEVLKMQGSGANALPADGRKTLVPSVNRREMGGGGRQVIAVEVRTLGYDHRRAHARGGDSFASSNMRRNSWRAAWSLRP